MRELLNFQGVAIPVVQAVFFQLYQWQFWGIRGCSSISLPAWISAKEQTTPQKKLKKDWPSSAFWGRFWLSHSCMFWFKKTPHVSITIIYQIYPHLSYQFHICSSGTHLLQIKSLVDFTEATFANRVKKLKSILAKIPVPMTHPCAPVTLCKPTWWRPNKNTDQFEMHKVLVISDRNCKNAYQKFFIYMPTCWYFAKAAAH